MDINFQFSTLHISRFFVTCLCLHSLFSCGQLFKFSTFLHTHFFVSTQSTKLSLKRHWVCFCHRNRCSVKGVIHTQNRPEFCVLLQGQAVSFIFKDGVPALAGLISLPPSLPLKNNGKNKDGVPVAVSQPCIHGHNGSFVGFQWPHDLSCVAQDL